MILLYSLFVFVGLLIAWGLSHIIAAAFGAPTVSSQKKVVEAALKLAQAKKGEHFLDLGCGWGKALHIAEKHGLKAEGIDISPACVIWNRLMGRRAHLGNIRMGIRIDIRIFDIVYIYLLPNLIKKLDLSNVKKGARIIAVDFPLIDRRATEITKTNKHTIYLYRY